MKCGILRLPTELLVAIATDFSPETWSKVSQASRTLLDAFGRSWADHILSRSMGDIHLMFDSSHLGRRLAAKELRRDIITASREGGKEPNTSIREFEAGDPYDVVGVYSGCPIDDDILRGIAIIGRRVRLQRSFVYKLEDKERFRSVQISYSDDELFIHIGLGGVWEWVDSCYIIDDEVRQVVAEDPLRTKPASRCTIDVSDCSGIIGLALILTLPASVEKLTIVGQRQFCEHMPCKDLSQTDPQTHWISEWMRDLKVLELKQCGELRGRDIEAMRTWLPHIEVQQTDIREDDP